MHPQAGGAEVRIHEIGKRLVQSGCSVKLICERWVGSKSVDFLDGVEIVRVAGRYGIHLKVPLLLNRVDGYDVVVDDIAHAVPWFSPLFTRKSVVGQVHHVHQEVLNLELLPFLARLVALSESTIRYLYKVLIVVSESTKRELISRFDVSEDRIKVVPNGVDLEVYGPMRKGSEPTVLWVGRVKRYKRVDHVLSAFRLVKKSFPDAKLFIVGDGNYLEVLKRISGRLGLSNVVFTGRVREEEKVRLMGSSWIIVSASLVEGWGMTIIEGAACATPAVAYDVAGLRDSVRDGVTGLLVEDGNVRALAEAVIRVLENEELRLRLGKNALEYARGFGWDRSAEEFLKVLK